MPAGPPDQPHQLVEEQDQAEGGEHLVEMVAAVEPPHRDHLERHADEQRRDQRQHRAERRSCRSGREGRGEVGADHVERAVRQIDQVHDAEDSVSPAASRNSSMPNCRPFRHCSMRYSIGSSAPRRRTSQARWARPAATSKIGGSAALLRRPSVAAQPITTSSGTCRAYLSWLSSTIVATVLSARCPSASFTDVLQVEVLDRDVVVAELEVAAHRLEVGLLHLLAHLVLLGRDRH